MRMYIMKERKPMIIVFAGPNGSGKSSVTSLAEISGEYINADEIKKALHCSDMDAAVKATDIRYNLLEKNKDFTFETVLSTERNLELLTKAKQKGYFIKCYYILTTSADINVMRVHQRFMSGGHDVPEDKVRSRYNKALELLPKVIKVCDICNVYDNTVTPFRIFSKKLGTYRLWENNFWDKDRITDLTKQYSYDNLK